MQKVRVVEGQAADTTRTTTWNIAAIHSHAQFKVKHTMISSVKGET